MPDALVLGFDCSAAHCAAALLSGDRVLAARHEEMSKGQAERLMPLLAEVLAEASVAWADLAAIGVGIGPGSFTGVRVAVAAARGLALGLGIPAVGIRLTEALSFDLPRPCRVTLPGRGGDMVWEDFGVAAQGPQIGPVLPDGPPEGLSQVPVAEAVARLAQQRRHVPAPRPAPVYLRPPDAAPARDTGPAILA